MSERKGKVTPCRWAEDRKSAGINSGKSSTKNLEAESIRSRAESTGGCVKLKKVTEVRPGSIQYDAIRYNKTQSVFDLINFPTGCHPKLMIKLMLIRASLPRIICHFRCSTC